MAMRSSLRLPPPPSSISFRSDPFLSKPVLPIPSQKKVFLSVKSMAVAKFWGTQMREKQLTEMIEKKVIEAEEACEGDGISAECMVAWDEVEEVSQAKADLRMKMEKEDPLESFCGENPETDECCVFKD